MLCFGISISLSALFVFQTVSTVWLLHAGIRFVAFNVAEAYHDAQCVQGSVRSCAFTGRKVGKATLFQYIVVHYGIATRATRVSRI